MLALIPFQILFMKLSKYQYVIVIIFLISIALVALIPDTYRVDAIYIGQFLILSLSLLKISNQIKVQVAVISLLLADVLYYLFVYKFGFSTENLYVVALTSTFYGISFASFSLLLIDNNTKKISFFIKEKLTAPALLFFIAVAIIYILMPGLQKFFKSGFDYSFLSHFITLFLSLPLALLSYLHLTNSINIKKQAVLTSLFILGILDIGIQLETIRYGDLRFTFYDILWFSAITIFSLFVNKKSFSLHLEEKRSIVNIAKKVFFLSALLPMLIIICFFQFKNDITPMYFIFLVVTIFIFGVFCIGIIQYGIEQYDKELNDFQKNPSESTLSKILEESPVEFKNSILIICNNVLDKENHIIREERKYLLETSSFYKRMAHDIASPLSVLNLICSSTQNFDDERRELLHKAMLRVKTIAGDILNKKALTSAELDKSLPATNMHDLLKSINELIMTKHIEFKGCNIKLVQDESDNTYQAYACLSDLNRILSNIINNSMAALNGNSVKEILIQLTFKSEYLRIEISDNGPGFPNEVLVNNLSKPYSFGKADGRGIGLYSAHRIIQQWCGNLYLFNANGAHVAIDLPSVHDIDDLIASELS